MRLRDNPTELWLSCSKHFPRLGWHTLQWAGQDLQAINRKQYFLVFCCYKHDNSLEESLLQKRPELPNKRAYCGLFGQLVCFLVLPGNNLWSMLLISQAGTWSSTFPCLLSQTTCPSTKENPFWKICWQLTSRARLSSSRPLTNQDSICILPQRL